MYLFVKAGEIFTLEIINSSGFWIIWYSSWAREVFIWGSHSTYWPFLVYLSKFVFIAAFLYVLRLPNHITKVSDQAVLTF
jgi:hypothetical protein